MRKITFCLAYLLLAVAVCSCSDDTSELETPSTVDTKAWTFDKNMDTSVKPGDNFFMYCNGKWWNETETPVYPPTYSVGLIYGAEELAEKIYSSLDDPTFLKWKESKDNKDQTTEYGLATIREKLGKVENITTKAEAWTAMCKLWGEGYCVRNVMLRPIGTNDGNIVIGLKEVFTSEETDKWLSYALERLGVDYTNVGDAATDDGEEMVDANKIFLAETGLDEKNFPQSNALLEIYKECSLNDLIRSVYRAIVRDVAMCSSTDIEQYSELNGNTLMEQYEKLFQHDSAYMIDHAYATKCITETMKAEYTEYCKQMKAAFRKRIENVDWMSSTTKQNAVDKLDAMVINVAYPDKWHTEGLPELNGKSLVENIIRLRQSYADLCRTIDGKSREEESFTAVLIEPGRSLLQENNAFYYPVYNSINIFPAWLMKPFYDNDLSDAYKYAVFTVIGHEMTHGFDANGSKYDKNGDSKNWWTVADKMEFEERQQLLIDCYNELEILPEEMPNEFTDGTRTLTENTADLGGFLIAFDMYKDKLTKEGYIGDEFVKQEKRFFQSYAELHRSKYGWALEEYRRIKNDPHSNDKERVNGVVMNVDRWYELYNVQWGDLLYLKPERRARIW